MSNNSKEYTDEALVQLICGHAADRDTAFNYIFKHPSWGKAALNILLRQGVGLQDAKEAVQEGVITFDLHIRNSDYKKEYALKNYFIGICKGRAYSNKRGRIRIDNSDDIPIIEDYETPESKALKAEKATIIRRLIKQLKEPCPEALKLYMLSFSRREIKEELNIKSEGMTGQILFDCRNKLAKLIDENPTLKRYFKN